MTSRLRAAFPALPKISDLDFALARTLDVHQVLLQLIGAPLFSWVTHLENVYADKVVPSSDFKTWTIQFHQNTKFSDGSPLTAAHWYHSIARTIRLGAGVHFNPKKDLVGGEHAKDGYCEGLVLHGNQVQLCLKEANPNFPRLIGKVEATVLPTLDQNFRLELLNQPGSGPYTLVAYTEDHATLKLNLHFPGHKKRAQFSEITIHRMVDSEAFEARMKGEVDFIFPMQLPSTKIRGKIEKNSQIYRDFGQTYFIGFRPKSKESPWLDNLAYRQALAAILERIPGCEGFERTETLIIGEGLGRLPSGLKFSSELKSNDLPLLSIAAVDKPVAWHIVEYLGNSGVAVDVTWVKSFNDLYTGKASKSDVIIGWNDFCAEDPYISLYNALNPDRPMWVDKENLRSELTQIQVLSNVSQKDTAYKTFHKKLLESAVVIPVFKVWFDAFAAKSLNIKPMKGSALWTLGT